MNNQHPSVRCHDDDDDHDDQFLGDFLLSAFNNEEQEDYFSLGLVVNWPAASSVLSPNYNSTNYERFLSAVKTDCFRGSDDVFFGLPFHALHITIAGLLSARKISQLQSENGEHKAGETAKNKNKDSNADYVSSEGDQQRSAFVAEWKIFLLRASSSQDWPKRPLELEIDSAQIRNRAGILLWKEHTGGIEKMRRCLEVAVREEELSSAIIRENFRIPNIIHTTFVRYHHREGTEFIPAVPRDDDDALFWRPSQAHSILIDSVVPNQALFTKSRNVNKDDGAGNHLPCETIKRVVANVANLVDCKIYLLGPRMEEDHEIFLSLPLQDSTRDLNLLRERSNC